MEVDVFSPATGEKIGSYGETRSEDVSMMYEVSRTAYEAWSTMGLRERCRLIKRLRETLTDDIDRVAESIAKSTGKIPVEAVTHEIIVVVEALSHIEKHAQRILRTERTKTPVSLIGRTSYIEYKPRGVVLVIAPWNFPFQLSVIPVVEALVAGNAVILKPSEVTPLVGQAIENLFLASGFPQGVLQVAHGGGELGAALVQGKPDYIHFTGSVRTGKKIQLEAAKELIPTTLELGGKDPMIVFSDANLNRAVQGAIWGAFCNSGQVCMSVERVYVERPIYQRFVECVVRETKKLRHGVDVDDDIGSMTFPDQIDVVKAHVMQALDGGATLLTGVHPASWDDGDMFIQPMVLTNVEQSMDVMQEETFGPVMPILPFESEPEAVRLANDTHFGLSASVWTSDLKRAQRVVSQLKTGNAVINDALITIANPYLPYGGVKDGGIGAYHGEVGIHNFCIRTSVMTSRGRGVREINWFPYRRKHSLFTELARANWGKKRSPVRFLSSYLKLRRESKRP